MNDNRLRKKLSHKSGFVRRTAPLALAVLLPVLGVGPTAHAADMRVGAVRLEPVRLAGDIDGGRYGNRYQKRQFSTNALNALQDRINWAQSRGALSAREANRLQDSADDLRNRSRAYWRSGGVDRQEARELDDRFQDLREEVRHLVWDREYRGQYRQEWRERSLWGENGWRGDSYRNQSGSNRAELKRSESDRDDGAPDFDVPDARAYAPQAAPKQYEAPKSPAPQPRTNGTQAPTPNDQPFKDGRDFH